MGIVIRKIRLESLSQWIYVVQDICGRVLSLSRVVFLWQTAKVGLALTLCRVSYGTGALKKSIATKRHKRHKERSWQIIAQAWFL